MSVAPHRRPGRPNDETLSPLILRAAIEELAVAGFEALSLEQVARRAGTAKTSLYRRWPSKDDLIVDALRMFVVETGLVDAARVDRQPQRHGGGTNRGNETAPRCDTRHRRPRR